MGGLVLNIIKCYNDENVNLTRVSTMGDSFD